MDKTKILLVLLAFCFSLHSGVYAKKDSVDYVFTLVGTGPNF